MPHPSARLLPSDGPASSMTSRPRHWPCPVSGTVTFRLSARLFAPDAGAPKIVLGPGTGFGAAALLPEPGGGWRAVCGEAGHMTLAAANETEAMLLAEFRPGVRSCLGRADCVGRGASAALPRRFGSRESGARPRRGYGARRCRRAACHGGHRAFHPLFWRRPPPISRSSSPPREASISPAGYCPASAPASTVRPISTGSPTRAASGTFSAPCRAPS